MTFRDKCNAVHKDVVKALAKYHKAEAAIGEPCSNTVKEKRLEARNKAYREWQEAQLVYNEFLGLVVQMNKNLDDKM
jgi:hypothetical protein